MARTVLILLAVLVQAVAATPASGAPTASLTATFTVQFPKGHPASNAPCDPDSFCGVGSLAGYGAATITILDETFDKLPAPECLATTRVEEIDLLDGSGSLVVESAGAFCRPGGSGDSHASDASYGSPGRFDLRFTIRGAQSSGVFAGTSGGGTETMDVAGGIGVWRLGGATILNPCTGTGVHHEQAC
jgi:hypothetical protein